MHFVRQDPLEELIFIAFTILACMSLQCGIQVEVSSCTGNVEAITSKLVIQWLCVPEKGTL